MKNYSMNFEARNKLNCIKIENPTRFGGVQVRIQIK